MHTVTSVKRKDLETIVMKGHSYNCGVKTHDKASRLYIRSLLEERAFGSRGTRYNQQMDGIHSEARRVHPRAVLKQRLEKTASRSQKEIM